MNYRLVAYAQDFASFLLEHLEERDKIKTIILFGSVVRGEAGKDSDIDIFIETPEKIDGEIEKIKEKFYKSVKVKKYWELLGIRNEFHCESGRLDEWGDIEKSLDAQGIVLFGKYTAKRDAKPYYLFSIEQMDERKKSISLWRKLYGYKQKVNKKVYAKKGLLGGYGGERIARGVFLVPSEHAQKVLHFLKDKKVRHRLMLFWKGG